MNSSFNTVTMQSHTGESVLHVIDAQDVALTPTGAWMVRKAARIVMSQHMPSLDMDKLSLSSTLALFLDQLFWEEGSGRLLMCAELRDACYCLPIPSEHWRVHTAFEQTQ